MLSMRIKNDKNILRIKSALKNMTIIYEDLEKNLREEITKKDEKIDTLDNENQDLKSALEALKFNLEIKEKRNSFLARYGSISNANRTRYGCGRIRKRSLLVRRVRRYLAG